MLISVPYYGLKVCVPQKFILTPNVMIFGGEPLGGKGIK